MGYFSIFLECFMQILLLVKRQKMSQILLVRQILHKHCTIGFKLQPRLWIRAQNLTHFCDKMRRIICTKFKAKTTKLPCSVFVCTYTTCKWDCPA